MTTVVIYAKSADELKTQIDALSATSIEHIIVCHHKTEYVVIYTP